eukprot:COSAG01_NODE_231_length_21019_cov_104.980501_5_plen_85_part_00
MEVWKTLLDDGDGDYDFSAAVAGDALGRRRSVPHVHYEETTPSVLIVLSDEIKSMVQWAGRKHCDGEKATLLRCTQKVHRPHGL